MLPSPNWKPCTCKAVSCQSFLPPPSPLPMVTTTVFGPGFCHLVSCFQGPSTRKPVSVLPSLARLNNILQYGCTASCLPIYLMVDIKLFLPLGSWVWCCCIFVGVPVFNSMGGYIPRNRIVGSYSNNSLTFSTLFWFKMFPKHALDCLTFESSYTGHRIFCFMFLEVTVNIDDCKSL